MSKSSNNIKVLIPVETGYRETLYKCYISLLLAQHGYEVFLGKKNLITGLISKVEPIIYFDKGYHQGVSDGIYKEVKKNKGIIISLDEEGGVDYGDNSTLLNRYSEKLFQSADLVFFWGLFQYRLISKNIKIHCKSVISGHPRFHILKEKYLSLYSPEAIQIKNKYGDFILINTNMGYGNNINGDEFIIRNYSSRVQSLRLLMQNDKIKLNSFISLVSKLTTLTDKKIIIRTHPEENRFTYINQLRKFKNVHVTYEHSVIPWLLSTNVMIHSDCTTAVESYLLGKKSISYLPANFNYDLVTQLPVNVSYNFNDEDELINFILTGSYNINIDGQNNHPLIEESISFSQDTPTLIIQEINKLVENHNKNNHRKLSKYDILKYRYVDYKKMLLRLKDGQLAINKLKGFNMNEIYDTKNRICLIYPNLKSIKMKRVSEGLFHFINS